MTDYLTGLALRNQRYGRGIRPRLPTRFEPGRGIGLPSAGRGETLKTTAGRRPPIPVPHELPAVEREREQPQVPSGTRHIPRSAARGRHAVTVTTGPDFPWGSPGQEKQSAGRGRQKTVPEEPVAEEEVHRRVSVPKNTLMAGERNVQEDSSGKPSQRNLTEKPLSLRSSLKAAETNVEQRTATEQKPPEPGTGKRGKVRAPVSEVADGDRRENTLPEKPVIRAVSFPAATTGRERIITPEDIRHYSPEPGAENRKIPAQEPRVQVTIGRIEIRSVPRREAGEHRPVLPELDLSDYLQYPNRRIAK
ncbi:MAG: hypothetical protein WCB46_06780 [Methanoregula sp.]